MLAVLSGACGDRGSDRPDPGLKLGKIEAIETQAKLDGGEDMATVAPTGENNAATEATSPPSAEGRPNVVLIIVDSLRADHMGVYGYKKKTTPRLDSFAKETQLFMRAYATAPWTLPSIASILSGLHQYELGIRHKDVTVDRDIDMLQEVMGSAGYKTGAVVSNTYLIPDYGLIQGFDHVDRKNIRGHKHTSSESITDEGLDFVRKQKEESFFILLHYFDPHYNYAMHEILNTYPKYNGRLFSNQNIKAQRKIAHKLKKKDIRFLNAAYDSEIRFTDHHIGRLFDGLKEMGLYEDSVIVFVADHGEELANRENRWIGHTKTTTEETLKIPFMIRLPGGEKPKKIEELASLVDLTPTILKLVGLEVPDPQNIHGVPLDLDEPENNAEYVFAETGKWRFAQTVHWKNWKYIKEPERRGQRRRGRDGKEHKVPTYLYNLKSDPGEKRNLADKKKGVVEALEAKRLEWNKRMHEIRDVLKPSMTIPKLDSLEEDQLRAMGYIQ